MASERDEVMSQSILDFYRSATLGVGPDQPEDPGVADLGYRLLQHHWRKGLASEGARELVRYGFDDVGLDRIIAQTLTVNAGSWAVMERVGLTCVRTFPTS